MMKSIHFGPVFRIAALIPLLHPLSGLASDAASAARLSLVERIERKVIDWNAGEGPEAARVRFFKEMDKNPLSTGEINALLRGSLMRREHQIIHSELVGSKEMALMLVRLAHEDACLDSWKRLLRPPFAHWIEWESLPPELLMSFGQGLMAIGRGVRDTRFDVPPEVDVSYFGEGVVKAALADDWTVFFEDLQASLLSLVGVFRKDPERARIILAGWSDLITDDLRNPYYSKLLVLHYEQKFEEMEATGTPGVSGRMEKFHQFAVLFFRARLVMADRHGGGFVGPMTRSLPPRPDFLFGAAARLFPEEAYGEAHRKVTSEEYLLHRYLDAGGDRIRWRMHWLSLANDSTD